MRYEGRGALSYSCARQDKIMELQWPQGVVQCASSRARVCAVEGRGARGGGLRAEGVGLQRVTAEGEVGLPCRCPEGLANQQPANVIIR